MAKGKSNPKTLEAVKRATKQARQADAASGGGAAPSEPTSSRPPPPSDARGGSGGKSRKSARGRRGARSDSDDDEEAAAAAAAAASAAREAKRGGATGTGSSARVQLGGFGIGCRGTGNEKARKLREEHDEAVRRKKATRKKEAEARAAREAAAGSLNQLAADEEEAAWRVRNPTRNARANRSKKDRGGGGGGGGGRGGRVDDEDEDDDVGAGVLARSALADLEETEEEDGDGEEAGRGVGGAGAGGFSLLRGSDDDDDEEEEEDEEDEEDPEPEPEPEPESVIEVEDAPAEDLEDVLVEDVPDEEPPPPPPPPPPEEAADAAAAAADDSESSAWETESDDDGAAPWEPRLRESLFDGVVSASFEENLDRMRVEHGFVPPYRRNLIVPGGAFYTLVPIRPRWRGERRSLRTFPGASLRPPLAFNPRPRRLSTPTDAFQLHPDFRLYGTARRAARVRADLQLASCSASVDACSAGTACRSRTLERVRGRMRDEAAT